MRIYVKTKVNNTTGYRPLRPSIRDIASRLSATVINSIDSKAATEAQELHAKKSIMQHSASRYGLAALPQTNNRNSTKPQRSGGISNITTRALIK